MPDDLEKLNNPWLIAAWPGMGSVAVLAASHLAQTLDAAVAQEWHADDFFEIEHVEVKAGLAKPGRLPRNVFLLWRDPRQARDLVLFIAENQPDRGGLDFCRQIAQAAAKWKVQRIITFAAMGTQLHPANEAGVFAVASDRGLAAECRRHQIDMLQQGQVGGMNGLMLAAASEAHIPALCLMGEMPYFAVKAPNPPAALAALRAFSKLTDLTLDLELLEQQARQVSQQLQQLVDRMTDGQTEADELGFTPPPTDPAADPSTDQPPELSPEQRQRIESLFDQVRHDRSQAVKLKRELDRLGVFDEYEDRFLDLFRSGE